MVEENIGEVAGPKEWNTFTELSKSSNHGAPFLAEQIHEVRGALHCAARIRVFTVHCAASTVQPAP